MIVVTDVIDFMAKPKPPREFIVEGIIHSRSLVQIAARRGTGKTWLSLYLSLAMASGSNFLSFSVPQPRKVLYVEPEMDGRELQERINLIARGLNRSVERSYLRLIPYCDNTEGLFNLNNLADQAELEDLSSEVEVIVLDGKKFLCNVLDENRPEEYLSFNEWLRKMRRNGKTVIFTAHKGKYGIGARGHSSQEDLLDVCIDLNAPSDYRSRQGMRAKWEITKGRGLSPENQDSLLISLSVSEEGAIFNYEVIADYESDKEVELRNFIRDGVKQGQTQAQIASLIGVSQPTVSRTVKELKAQGDLFMQTNTGD